MGRRLLHSLRKAASQLLLLFFLVILFFLAFSVYGMSTFQNSLARRCVFFERHVPSCASSHFGAWPEGCDPGHWEELNIDTQITPALTGGYPFEMACKIYDSADSAPRDALLPVVLQDFAVFCFVMKCVAVCCSVLQCGTVCFSVLQRGTPH